MPWRNLFRQGESTKRHESALTEVSRHEPADIGRRARRSAAEVTGRPLLEELGEPRLVFNFFVKDREGQIVGAVVLPSSLDLKPQSDGSYKSLCPWRDDKHQQLKGLRACRGVIFRTYSRAVPITCWSCLRNIQ